MATSHIASISAGNRLAAQRITAAASAVHVDSNDDPTIHEKLPSDQLSQLSLADGDSLSRSLDQKTISRSRRSQDSTQAPPLSPLSCLKDIDSQYENDSLHQMKVLNLLEQQWLKIVRDFDATVQHLGQSSSEVSEASINCLEALDKNVGDTCDKVDAEIKAMYHLMTKCDELTTKLSIATSFRDEIKTLRKSIETLDQLFKARSQLQVQKRNPSKQGE